MRWRPLVVILSCLAVLVPISWFATSRLTALRSDARDVIKHGQHVHVACVNESCGHEQGDYRAKAQDKDWPKSCPKCGRTTLRRAVRCYHCRNYTPWQTDGAGRVTCRKCQTWLNPPPGLEGPNPAAP